MAIFARRRLDAMLQELSRSLDHEQALGLVRRIESKEIEQALHAEIELALIWAISKLGAIEIEPVWYSENRVPDLFSEHLFPGREAIIEITGLSDAALPADQGMRNASRKISQEVGRLRRGASRQISYYFYEETVRLGPNLIRRVCVPRDLTVSDAIKTHLRGWIVGQDRKDGDKLHIEEGELSVVLTWNSLPQSQFNFFTSMPPEVWHLTDNYVYRALKSKAKQIRNPHFKGVKCIILADVGSTALRQFDRLDHTGRVFSGGSIVQHFMHGREGHDIDVVLIVTPNREHISPLGFKDAIEWKIGVFCRTEMKVDVEGVQRIASTLPKPLREGYQSRQLHEQAVFSPKKRGRYLGTSMTWRKGEKTEIRISARAFLDLLAGRIAPEYAARVFGAEASKVITAHLDRGETISGLRYEPGGPDKDDDYIVLDFQDDAAARMLSLPSQPR